MLYKACEIESKQPDVSQRRQSASSTCRRCMGCLRQGLQIIVWTAKVHNNSQNISMQADLINPIKHQMLYVLKGRYLENRILISSHFLGNCNRNETIYIKSDAGVWQDVVITISIYLYTHRVLEFKAN